MKTVMNEKVEIFAGIASASASEKKGERGGWQLAAVRWKP